MSDEKLLTKEIAEQFLADEDSVDLSEFTAIDDDAAEIIGRLRVHPFFAGSIEEDPRFFGVEHLSDVTEKQLRKLLPSKSELAQVFADRMTEAINEAKQTGSLAVHLDKAVAGVNALTVEWREDGADPDFLWVTSKEVRGESDSLGDPLTSSRLYLQWGPLDSPRFDEGYAIDFANGMMGLLGEEGKLQKRPMFTGDFEDRAYFIPMDRICEALLQTGWPFETMPLELSLKGLSVEHAKALSLSAAKVILSQVEAISEECAAILNGTACQIEPWGLRNIPETESHYSLVEKIADHEDELMFDSLAEVNEGLAQHLFNVGKEKSGISIGPASLSDSSLETLIRIQGYFGWGVRDLSDSQAELLCHHNADLFLNELTSLSDEAATRLSQFPYGLSLDLEKIPPSAAEILRSHPSFAESEDDDYDEEDWDDED